MVFQGGKEQSEAKELNPTEEHDPIGKRFFLFVLPVLSPLVQKRELTWKYACIEISELRVIEFFPERVKCQNTEMNFIKVDLLTFVVNKFRETEN